MTLPWVLASFAYLIMLPPVFLHNFDSGAGFCLNGPSKGFGLMKAICIPKFLDASESVVVLWVIINASEISGFIKVCRVVTYLQLQATVNESDHTSARLKKSRSIYVINHLTCHKLHYTFQSIQSMLNFTTNRQQH